MIASLGACSPISRRTSIFTSSRSGTFSCTKSAPLTACSMEETKSRRSGLAPSASPACSMIGQALSIASRKCASAPGAGSVTLTSSPWARQRIDHPVPITPPPTRPTRWMSSRPLNFTLLSSNSSTCRRRRLPEFRSAFLTCLLLQTPIRAHTTRLLTPSPRSSGRGVPPRHLARNGQIEFQSMPCSESGEAESGDGMMSSMAARPFAAIFNTATPRSRNSSSRRRAFSFGAKNASIP